MLTAKKVERLKAAGRYHDGHGLHLQVRHAGNKSWLLRYERDGRERWLGLGPVHVVTLKQARERARAAKLLLLDGIDPIDHRKEQRAAQAAARVKRTTFGECVNTFLPFKRPEWKNEKHAKQWEMCLRVYARPLHGISPADIDLAMVAKTLEPIWNKIPETASRTRQRIEAVLDHWSAKNEIHGYRNPAAWERLKHVLPSPSKIKEDRHHAALPYREVPGFMTALRAREGTAARALEFAILTAGRTNEIIGAQWGEIDLAAGTWTVPPARMKSGRRHRVPLSTRAIELLQALPTEDRNGFIFVGPRAGSGLSNMSMTAVLRRMGYGHVTTHGFRSSFRDWCAEETNFPREIAEFALAHVVGDKSEAAYWRADVLRKRKQLAEAWSRYCGSPAAAAVPGKVVVPIRL